VCWQNYLTDKVTLVKGEEDQVCPEPGSARIGETRITDATKQKQVDLLSKGIGAETSTVVMQLDKPNKFPVKYITWEPTSDIDFTPHCSFHDIIQSLKRHETGLIPLDDSSDSPWIEHDHNLSALGECSYDIRHGAKDDLKSVFEISHSKIKEIEPNFVYPYLKSKDIVRN